MKQHRSRNGLDDEVLELLGGEPELLAIADAVQQTQARPIGAEPRRPQTRQTRRWRVGALIAAAIAGLMIAPAYALTRHDFDFFSGKRADNVEVKRFQELGLAPTATMNPRVISSEARMVSTYSVKDEKVAVFVAPTSDGGFCEEIEGFATTCDATRANPLDVGLAVKSLAHGPAVVFGSVLDGRVNRIELQLQDHKTRTIQTLRVSAPISASFFVAEVDLHDQPVLARALSADGRTLAVRRLHGIRIPPGDWQ